MNENSYQLKYCREENMFKCKGTLIRQLYIGFTEKTNVIQTFFFFCQFMFIINIKIIINKDNKTIKSEWNFFLHFFIVKTLRMSL